MQRNVGERIRYLREENHITQKELGVCLNIDTSGVSRMETNNRPLDDTTIVKLAQFFHTSSDYILCLSNQKETKPLRLTPLEKKFLTILRQFTSQEQKKLMDIIEDIYNISHKKTPVAEQ